MKNIGAFFDIDGTLYREALLTEIFKKLIRSEIIEEELWYNEVREKYHNWSRRIGNYDDYLLKIAEIYTESIVGLHRTQIEFIASKVVSQKGDRVYIFTRDRIKWHLEQGHTVIAVSGSPSELVREMAAKHHFDDYTGTIYQVDDQNIYTREVIPMWDSKNKKKAIADFVEKYDLDLSKSYAYGDTSGDWTMLQSVGNPVAMNPTRELLTRIKEDKELNDRALVVVERKDMIYRLNPDQIRL